MMRYFKSPTLLFALALLCMSGCSRSNIRLEKNEFDNKVRFASNRLDGKRQKTKNVKKLEAAFAQANQIDLRQIDSLRSIDTPLAWELIHALNQRIKKRQQQVEPLLPLVSDNGYRLTSAFYPSKPC